MIKVKQKSRERGENWVQEEKDLFIELMRQSASIIENKQTDTNTNKKKIAEWLKVQSKLKELTGKSRDIGQLKGFWRRTKMTAKKNVSGHRRAIRSTGGGLHPPSPLPEDLKIMELCPTDFVIEHNKFDSDGISQNADNLNVFEDEAQHSTIYDIEMNETNSNEAEASVIEVITVADVHNNEVDIKTQKIEDNKVKKCNQKKKILYPQHVEEVITMVDVHDNEDHIIKTPQCENKEKKNSHKIKEYPTKHYKNVSSHKGMIVSSNVEFKNRSLQLLEEEHKLKIEKLKLENIHLEQCHKLELEILLLEKEKKELEIKILRKNLI